MLFSSNEFLFLFLPLSLLLYFIIPIKFRNLALFAVSLVFYGWGEPIYVFLMVFTIISNYVFGFFIEKLAGRIDILHLKDAEWVKDNKDKDHLMYTSIGDGNLNWKGIIESAEKIGVKHYIVEQDGRWENNDPFKSAARSAKYIKENLM